MLGDILLVWAPAAAVEAPFNTTMINPAGDGRSFFPAVVCSLRLDRRHRQWKRTPNRATRPLGGFPRPADRA